MNIAAPNPTETPRRETVLQEETPDGALIVLEPLSEKITRTFAHLKQSDLYFPVFTQAEIKRDEHVGATITLSGDNMWGAELDAISQAMAPFFTWSCVDQAHGYPPGFSGTRPGKDSARTSVTFPVSHAKILLPRYRTTLAEAACATQIISSGKVARPLITSDFKKLIEAQIKRLFPKGAPRILPYRTPAKFDAFYAWPRRPTLD